MGVCPFWYSNISEAVKANTNYAGIAQIGIFQRIQRNKKKTHTNNILNEKTNI